MQGTCQKKVKPPRTGFPTTKFRLCQQLCKGTWWEKHICRRPFNLLFSVYPHLYRKASKSIRLPLTPSPEEENFRPSNFLDPLLHEGPPPGMWEGRLFAAQVVAKFLPPPPEIRRARLSSTRGANRQEALN